MSNKHATSDATLRDFMKLSTEYGVTAKDVGLSALLYGKILKSENAEEVMKRLSDYEYGKIIGSSLIEEPDADTEYVIGMMKYSGGGDPVLTMKVREDALTQVKRINEDPAYRDALRQEASEYVREGNEDYTDLRKSTWKKIEEEANLEDKWSWGKELIQINNEQYEEAKDFFYGFYRNRMKSLISHGWRPKAAANEILNQMKLYYGATSLVEDKKETSNKIGTSLVKNKIMYMPPERKYPKLSAKELQRRFKSFAESLTLPTAKAGGFSVR